MLFQAIIQHTQQADLQIDAKSEPGLFCWETSFWLSIHLDVDKDRGKNLLKKLAKEVMRIERVEYFPALIGNKAWLI